MIKRSLTLLALLLSPFAAFADGVSDATASVAFTVYASDVDESIATFPVFLSDMPAGFWSALDDAGDTTGATIRATDNSATTEYAIYVVSINTGTDTGCIIIEGNPSASVDNFYRLHVGSPTASMYATGATYGRDDCFSAFAGYYMPGMTTADLTGGGRTLTAVASPGTTASGYEGVTAATYNGSTQYHKYEGTQAVTDWPVTLAGLAYTTTTSSTQSVVSLGDTGSDYPVAGIGFHSSGAARTDFRGDSGSNSNALAGTYSATTWYLTTATRNANTGTSTAYLNTTSGTNATTITTPTFDNVAIGCWLRTGVIQPLSGRVAAAWLYDSAQSANFIATEYASWSAAFYTVGGLSVPGILDATVYVPVTVAAADVDESIPGFPVFLSDMPAEFWTALSDASDTTGATIRVTETTGSTQLAFYVISIDTGTETGCLWVEGDPSASVDTTYRIYAGSPTASLYSATDTYGRNAAFSQYAGYYLPGMTTADLTGAGRDLTPVASPGTAASGYEGVTAATYNGSTQYHKYEGTQAVSAPPPISLSCLALTNTLSGVHFIAAQSVYASGSNTFSLWHSSSAAQAGVQGNGGSAATAALGTITTATWYQFVNTRDTLSGDTYGYQDGTQYNNTTTINAYSTHDRFVIGALALSSAYNYFFNGNVAAAWLYSGTVKSANFIATEYASWQSAFYTAGTAVELGGSCTSGSTGWVLFQGVAQGVTANEDWATLSNAIVDDANAATNTLNETTKLYSEIITFDDPDYGTTIPTDANSYTVSLRVKRSAETSSAKDVRDFFVKFVDETGAVAGDDLAKTTTQWPSTAASTDYTVTGVTFDGSEFDADTGMQLQAWGDYTNGDTTTNVFVAWIKIDWVCDATAADLARGFFILAE